jgi:hypothetical protein
MSKIDVSQIKPLGRHILAVQCKRDDRILDAKGEVVLFTPDAWTTGNGIKDGPWLHWFKILALGPACKVHSHKDIGKFIRVPEIADRLWEIAPGLCMIHEETLDKTTGGYTVSEP